MGGSFDPPHKTHLEIAENARDFLALDCVFFVPAYASPLKANPHIASFEDRKRMLEIALQNFATCYKIFEIEKERGGTSYSIDTVKYFKNIYPDSEFYWIIGADQLIQLDKWHKIDELSKLVKFACFRRTNFEFQKPENLPQNTQIVEIPFSQKADSSSRARVELKNRSKNLDFIDEKVLDYIKQNKLYL